MRIGDAATDIDVRVQRPAQPARPAPQLASTPDVQARAQAARQASAAQPVEVPKIESVTRQIDSYLRSINKSLQFSVDKTTGETVVEIRDDSTGEVIRQVPNAEALRIAQRIEDSLSAMLDEKA